MGVWTGSDKHMGLPRQSTLINRDPVAWVERFEFESHHQNAVIPMARAALAGPAQLGGTHTASPHWAALYNNPADIRLDSRNKGADFSWGS